jgi:hypothetical protein
MRNFISFAFPRLAACVLALGLMSCQAMAARRGAIIHVSPEVAYLFWVFSLEAEETDETDPHADR